MKNTIWSVEDIAFSLYAYMQLHEEFDTFTTDRYKGDISDTLIKMNQLIEEHLDYPKAETLFTLIFEYGEIRSKSTFIDGYRSGIEVENINNKL